MHVVNLIANALRNEKKETIFPFETKEETCCLTGQRTTCVGRENILGKSFTNLDLLAAPQSAWIGVDAAIALKHKQERSMSWFCTDENFFVLNRKMVRDIVFEKEMPDIWAGYVTTSFKKHGSLRTKLNSGNSRYWLFETRLVNCSNYGQMRSIYEKLCAALEDGFPRPVLETLDISSYYYETIGVKKCQELIKWASPWRLSALYSFMIYLLPSMEERGVNAKNKTRMDS